MDEGDPWFIGFVTPEQATVIRRAGGRYTDEKGLKWRNVTVTEAKDPMTGETTLVVHGVRDDE